MKLTNPGVDLPHWIQFFHKGRVLVGDVPGYSHLAQGVHGKSHGKGVHDLLQVCSVCFRHGDVSQFLELGNVFDGNEFISWDNLFQHRDKKKLWEGDAIDSDGSSIIAVCMSQFFC